MTNYILFSLVFVASFCLMVAEIIAGRVVAPFVGSSIYTWTSIIGVFLFGIALGNWLGGRLADRYPNPRTFGFIFLLASMSAASIIIVTPLWNFALGLDVSLPTVITIFSFITFFPLAFFLSFVTPLAIKLALQNIQKTGSTVGNIYGFSAAGSIIGTFATGFWLIADFGSKNTIWAVFALLAFIGFYFLYRGSNRKIAVTFFLLVFVVAGNSAYLAKNICQTETQYYCIRIRNVNAYGQRGLALVLDLLEHSHIYPAELDPFGDNYTRFFGLLANYKFKTTDEFKALVIGGGGYIVPRYLINTFPKAQVIVFEIDPGVTKTNIEKLGLVENERLRIMHGDARFLINRLSGEKFDIIYGDAFNDYIVPFQLTTREFLQEVTKHMTPGGIYSINLVASYKHGSFLGSNLLTIASVFPQTYLFPLTHEIRDTPQTAVIVASYEEIDRKKIEKIIPFNDPLWEKLTPTLRTAFKIFKTITDPELQEFIKNSGGIILTDNYAPVENMLSPLFAER